MTFVTDFRREILAVDPRLGMRFITLFALALSIVLASGGALWAACRFMLWAHQQGLSAFLTAATIAAAFAGGVALIYFIGRAVVRFAAARGFHF